MAFMGMMFAGIFLVIIIAAVAIYLLIGLILMIIGIVGVIRNSRKTKKYAEWAQTQPEPVPPFKKKKAPFVVMGIGIGMWAVFALLVAFVMISSRGAYEKQQAERNLFDCIHEGDYDAALERLEAGECIDSAGNTNADPFEHAAPGEDTVLYSLCSGDVYEEDEALLKKIEFLIDNGADVNWQVYHHEPSHPDHRGSSEYGFQYTDRCGMTPLMAAASSGRVETVKLLLEHGADVNAVTYSGRNALMYAATSFKGERSADVVRVLIEAGIDVRARDNFGQNVWDYARWADNDAVKRALHEEATWTSYDVDPAA